VVKNISSTKNLHFVSVYCQALLSTAVSMRISFFLLDFFSLSLSLKYLYFLSLFVTLSFLTFYYSLIFSVFYRFSFSLSFNWIMITFSFLNLFEKKNGICYTTTYITVSNKKKEFIVLKCSKKIR